MHGMLGMPVCLFCRQEANHFAPKCDPVCCCVLLCASGQAKNSMQRDLAVYLDLMMKTGCTVTSDGWSSVTRRPLLNVCVVTPKGTMFECAIDTSGEEKSGSFIFQKLSAAVQRIGSESVVCVITDSASNCVVSMIA